MRAIAFVLLFACFTVGAAAQHVASVSNTTWQVNASWEAKPFTWSFDATGRYKDSDGPTGSWTQTGAKLTLKADAGFVYRCTRAITAAASSITRRTAALPAASGQSASTARQAQTETAPKSPLFPSGLRSLLGNILAFLFGQRRRPRFTTLATEFGGGGLDRAIVRNFARGDLGDLNGYPDHICRAALAFRTLGHIDSTHAWR